VLRPAGACREGGARHIFQALQYLRKVCTHPALVMSPHHPQYAELRTAFDTHALENAPKLLALR
jgi:TATA-binding protein-associated factor